MYMTAIKEVNKQIIYIIIPLNTALLFCRVCGTTNQGINILFSGKLTRCVVKIQAPEMISTYI